MLQQEDLFRWLPSAREASYPCLSSREQSSEISRPTDEQWRLQIFKDKEATLRHQCRRALRLLETGTRSSSRNSGRAILGPGSS